MIALKRYSKLSGFIWKGQFTHISTISHLTFWSTKSNLSKIPTSSKTLSILKFPPYLPAPCFPFSPFAISFSSTMALKISRVVHILLWLSLLFLLFHEYYNLKSKINKKQIIQTSHSLPSHHPLISRKILTSKFDFTPFFKQHHNPPGVAVKQDPSDTEIDPRYGVEKRRVPTGPNPLHHWLDSQFDQPEKS